MPRETGESAAATAARLTLQHCNADPHAYACIFTSGATAALALLADAFPWTPGRSHFLPTVANHTCAAPRSDDLSCSPGQAECLTETRSLALNGGSCSSWNMMCTALLMLCFLLNLPLLPASAIAVLDGCNVSAYISDIVGRALV